MRKWLATAVALGAVLMFGSSAWSAANMVVSGVITNWKEVMARVPASAYLQLVKLDKEMKGTTDAQGLSAYDSDLPRITVRPDGSFKATFQDLSPGEYIIALQRAAPRTLPGSTVQSGTAILIMEDGNPLIIKVPGTFPLKVGKVIVAVKAEKTESPKK